MLALGELVHELVVIGERTGLLVALDEGLREVEIHLIAARVLGIVLQKRGETIDRTRVPLLTEVEKTDLKVGPADSIHGFTQTGLRLRQQRAGRIPGDELLELLDGIACFRLVALG